MSPPRLTSLALALGRLKRWVVCCCLLVGLAFTVQVVIWSLVDMTDIRFDHDVESPSGPVVVHGGSDESSASPQLPPDISSLRSRAARHAADSGASQRPAGDGEAPTVIEDEDRPALSSRDGNLGQVMGVTSTLGRLAALLLPILIGLGVILGASGQVSGAERTVTAFLTATVLALVALPVGALIDVASLTGALTTYSEMTGTVDAVHADERGGLGYYGQFLLLPVICIVACVFTALAFISGIERGLFEQESHRLDPALEKEISKIKPGNLRGSAASVNAFNRMVSGQGQPVAVPDEEEDPHPRATQVSPGRSPQRLI